MKISIVQLAPTWEDAYSTCERIRDMVDKSVYSPDIILLPEMFATGFSMNAAKNAGYKIFTLQWMQALSNYTDALVVGTMAVYDHKKYYNRMYWVDPDGECCDSYDKHHLFGMSFEPKVYTPGNKRKTFEWRGWKIRPIVCYDLRFPEWCRNRAADPYDLMLCCAAWPRIRIDAWKTLLKARAIENQCYVAGANIVGRDDNYLEYNGESQIFTPRGEQLESGNPNCEETINAELSLRKLQEFRIKFPVLDDAD